VDSKGIDWLSTQKFATFVQESFRLSTLRMALNSSCIMSMVWVLAIGADSFVVTIVGT